MSFKNPVSIVAQTENGQFSENGIQYFAEEVIGINADLGLIVLAQGEHAAAHKSVEILLDDMNLNLTTKMQQSKLSASIVSQCLSESLENMNEYLCFQSERTNLKDDMNEVNLVAIQIHQNNLSCCNVGQLNCLKFNGTEIKPLFDNSTLSVKLGVATSLTPVIVEQGLAQGDILLLSSPELIEKLGLEFIRVTLSRFHENLEMALRQINTRYMRNAIQQKPALILCRMNQAEESRGGWFDKFRKH